MDFGVMTHQETSGNASLDPGESRDNKSHGSGNLKQERSGLSEESLKATKMPRIGELEINNPSKKSSQTENFSGFGRSSPWFSANEEGQTMLSFSSAQPHPSGASQSIAFSITKDQHQGRTGVYGSEGLNSGMRGPSARFKGPFTPSQWMELEHQALIYKHIVANVPIPTNLLLPLRRSLCPYGFSSLSSGSYASNSFGWGPFHLGLSGNHDPEPGRCRRTDGKKWRCSRDAVPDQKYCERHINRGRHRSRKPVEGQNGHAVSGSTTSKVAPVASSASASVISSSGASNTPGAMHHHLNTLQPNTITASSDHHVNRTQELQCLSLTSPNMSLKNKEIPFSVHKQYLPFGESSRSEFGLVSSASLLNPSGRISNVNSRIPASFLGFSEQETNDQNPIRHFIDNWPKGQSDHAAVSWPEELKSDWTQLSMSIPVTPADFSSSSNSPHQEKLTLSPPRASREIDSIHMSLGMITGLTEPVQRQTTWLPVSWENPMGGPLGEVLTTSSTCSGAGKNSSALNLMTEDWDSRPQLGYSPTGVLQRSTYVSLSNSSSGSSPRADDKKAPDGVTICNNVLGSVLANSAAIPSV